MLEYYDQTVNSPNGSYYIPAVLRVCTQGVLLVINICFVLLFSWDYTIAVCSLIPFLFYFV